MITDLAIMLLTAGVVTIVFKKLNQPTVLGYILAGFLISPYMPWFFTVIDSESISTWSEIGIIIMMFSLGLEFNLHKLAQVGGTGAITALTEVGGMMLLGYVAGQAMGWSSMDSIFLGGMLSMSSTTIIIKAFSELGVSEKGFAQLVFGTLVIEDIAGIFMMIILSTVSVSQNVSGIQLASSLGLLVLYLAIWLILGIYLLPSIMNKASSLMTDETLLILSLGICFGMVLLADALGFSSALGAFLAGSLLAGTVHAERVEHLTKSVKDLFGAVFFLSVGMLIDPAMIVKYIWPILIITLITIFGKLIFSSLGVLLSGQKLSVAIHCGCSLAQIGEFAFIIASLGLSLGVIADYIYPIIVSVSVITTLTTPTFIRSADKIASVVEKILPHKLVQQLNRLTNETHVIESQDSDWSAFLKRYGKKTALFGIIMFGIVIIESQLLIPLAGKLPINPALAKAICLVLTYFLIALFVRPMLDTKSPQFTMLWVKSKQNRLPLIGLTALRALLIVLFLFMATKSATNINGVWILFIIALVAFLMSRSGWFASRYLSVEARFLANFNERQLNELWPEKNTQWLDENLFVLRFVYHGETKKLRELNWGRNYGISVIKIVSGDRHFNIPSADDIVKDGDTIYALSEAQQIQTLCAALKIEDREAPTLRAFTASQTGDDNDIYTYAIPVEKESSFVNSTIRDCGIRENYSCLILGLQRNNLPIVQPDINMQIQVGDLVWILGTKRMAGRILVDDI